MGLEPCISLCVATKDFDVTKIPTTASSYTNVNTALPIWIKSEGPLVGFTS